MRTSIAELIADQIGAMPASERRAAQTLIANYPLIGLKTVAEFSQQAGVSLADDPAFCLAGSASRTIPNSSRRCRTNSPRSCSRRATAHAQPVPRTGGAVSPIVEAIAREHPRDVPASFRTSNLTTLRRSSPTTAPRPSWSAAASPIRSPATWPRISTIIRPDVIHLTGQESNWRDRLIDMGKRDVLVIFDIRRYQDSLIRFAEKAHQRGVQIVLFTDQWLSPIARFARHVIAGRTAVPSPWDSSAALFVVAETLIGE